MLPHSRFYVMIYDAQELRYALSFSARGHTCSITFSRRVTYAQAIMSGGLVINNYDCLGYGPFRCSMMTRRERKDAHSDAESCSSISPTRVVRRRVHWSFLAVITASRPVGSARHRAYHLFIIRRV